MVSDDHPDLASFNGVCPAVKVYTHVLENCGLLTMTDTALLSVGRLLCASRVSVSAYAY